MARFSYGLNLMNRQQEFIQAITSISNKVNSKAFAVAISEAHTLLKRYPNQPAVTHLLAIAYSGQGALDESIKAFQQTLELDQANHEIHNNLANAYKKCREYTLAERHYLCALNLKPNFFDALRNLGLLYFQMALFEKSKLSLLKALKIKPAAGIYTALGNCERELGHCEAAVAWYKKALSVDAIYINALHNLALTYKIFQRFAEAEPLYQRVIALQPENPTAHYNYANVLFELGHFRAAEQGYLRTLELDPDFLQAHETISDFYWMLDKKASFDTTYETCLPKAKKRPELLLSQLHKLVQAQHYEKAEQLLSQFNSSEESAEVSRLRANIYAGLQQYKEAAFTYERQLKRQFHCSLAVDFVKLLISQNDIAYAGTVLDECEKQSPLNQMVLALRGLQWKLEQDEKYHWLNNYTRFVKQYTLAAPEGYTSLAEFLEELKVYLLTLHAYTHSPLGQTLVNGTQSTGALFTKQNPLVFKLKSAISECLKCYLDALSTDNKHPFLRRKSNNFKYSGSWSIKLLPSGFHFNHAHSEGWISSACYIHLPTTLGTGQDNKQGYLKFGQSPFELGDVDQAELYIKPTAGSLVLFPSYFWHGTEPFSGTEDDYRLTTPFDVLPC